MDNNGETDNKVETGSDVEPDDKSKTNEGTGAGADTDSEDTKDNASSSTTGDSTTTADAAANDTPQTLPTDNIDTTAGKTTTNDILDTMDEDEDEDDKQDSVTRSTDDAETADDAATDNGTAAYSYPAWVYVAVADNFGAGWTVKFNSNKAKENEQENWLVKQDMGEQKTLYDGRRVFGFELTQENCPNNGYSRIQFLPYNGNDQQNPIYEASNKWKDIKDFANKLYDAKKNEWVNYKPFDPTDHTAFSGKKMAFKNASNDTLTNVVAHFYEKNEDGSFTEVETQNLNNKVSAGAKEEFKIPTEKPCGFVQFTAGEPAKNISSRYNFYGQTGDEDSFLYNEETQFCFVYSANNMAHWGTGEGQRTIYYDATFSKLSADTGFAIPSNVGGKVYYYLTDLTGEGKADKAGEMTRQTNDLYSVDIEDGYDHIIFGAYKPTSATNVAIRGNSTANLEIPDEYTSPCFYADTGDDSTYGGADWHTNLTRDGYWAEVNTLRDAEKGKGKTNDPVVNVPSATFTPEHDTKYINTTLYDYYTDWELNGNNRDKYDVNNGATQRNWVTFRQFDQALSDYYIAYNSTNKEGKSVAYPIYTGHFQSDETGGELFRNVASALNLYGWDQYKPFMAVNNAYIDIDGTTNLAGTNNKEDKNNYVFTFQGLVSDTLNEDGNPTLYNTNLAEPHFNKAFLEGGNSKKAVLGKVYENVDFPFTKEDVFKNGVSYWHYESNDKSLFLKQKQGMEDQYFLQQPAETVVRDKMVSNNAQNVDSSSTPLGTYGFFPFNEGSKDKWANTYNYGFGAKLQLDFTLTDDGQVLDNKGNKVPIQFFFSGDDDVWVYIDNQLALDVGGAHGKASGLLEFGPKNNEGKNTYTAYVSKVKAGNKDQSYTSGANKSVNYLGSQISFNYQSEEKTLTPGKHTLRLFYMERGMWESNMAIAFNFPDHNELQVEKKVDLGDVKDPEFAACFTNQKLFNFTILNQATHYGPKPVDKNSVQLVDPKKLSSTDYTLGRMGNLENNSNNYCEVANDPDTKETGQVIHWYAEYDDTHSDYRDARMGVIKLYKSVNITGMDYLSFYIYASGKKGEGTLSLSNMYLQLVDCDGNVLGCNDKESLSGTTYNQVDLKNDEWIKIKLDLSRLTKDSKDSTFDMTQLKEIRIGDNYQRHIYFKDFTFTANPTVKKITGFTTEQKDIPDYDSAEAGELKPAVNAQFSSSIDGETRAVDENGQFTLQDKEVVTFSDQFRRGSYLSVTEDADAALFDTTWTIYENGVPVETMKSGNTVTNAAQTNVVKQSGNTPDDGRTEKTSTEIGLPDDQSSNSYNGEKPKEKAIVFRSYTNPDAGDAAELTKLKLQFVNKVKTGSLTIKKEAAAGEQELIRDGEYTFMVTFTGVGGLALESQPIEEPVTIKGIDSYTISGIPVGTRFHIVETNASNEANVSGVTVSGGGTDCKVVNGKEAIGTIVEGNDKVAIATFTNTMRTLIDIDLTKKWVDAEDNALPDKNLPDTIYVQLQRKTKDSDWKTVDGTDQNYVEVKRNDGGWTHKFTNLDANDYTSTVNPRPVYQYRVVEGVLVNGEFVAKNPETDVFLLTDGYTYTYEDGEMKSTTADGKTNYTITLTNKRLDPKFNLDITKKDAEDGITLLENVEFTLEKLTADGKDVDVDFTARIGITNALGEVKEKGSDGNPTEDSAFTGLQAGKYRLTETKAKAGYNLLSAPIEVEFTKTGECWLNGSKIEVWTQENPTDFTKNGNDSYTLSLTVLNRKTPALPHTGADAPSLWLLIGLPLAVAGLLILVFRYNKKGGRTR